MLVNDFGLYTWVIAVSVKIYVYRITCEALWLMPMWLDSATRVLVKSRDDGQVNQSPAGQRESCEISLLKRVELGMSSERLSPPQASLLDDLFDTDVAAVEADAIVID